MVMPYQYLLVEKREGIAVITMNRPNAFNALNMAMLPELELCLEECSNDSEVRVVVLTGAGNAFCSGGDISEFASDPRGAQFITQDRKSVV